MTTHYYLGWFDNGLMPRLQQTLREDITERHLLVMISALPGVGAAIGQTERSWLHAAGIHFERYEVIDEQTTSERAQQLVKEASVVFLLGGDTVWQQGLLQQSAVIRSLKQSEAVILGASAGAINLSATWICSTLFGYDVERETIYPGVGLHHMTMLSHVNIEPHLAQVKEALHTWSYECPVYIANKDCALRFQHGEWSSIGNIYVYRKGDMEKLPQSL